MKRRNRERDEEAQRYFTERELWEIKQTAHNWFVNQASRNGMDEMWTVECVAEACVRWLIANGRMEDK